MSGRIEYTHLAFKGARYAICGATVNDQNPATADVVKATCPDCINEHYNSETANASLHLSGLKAEYEI